MIWHLVALVVAGLGAGGVAMALYHLSRKKLPKWIIPGFAGVAMLAYQINFEYGWFEHKQLQLPEDSVVIESHATSMVWRPWTFAKPMTTSFTVLDKTSLVQVEQQGEKPLVRFMLYRFEKEYVDQVYPSGWLMNCAIGEMVGLELDGSINPVKRAVLQQDGKLYQEVCLTSER
ncbi:hypothetical protein [Marinospirillum alkaliphilum]|uniref:Uncharacterized protein n=1 Tax=Marinospirillum alkaliphilum DSM 21637 TaxID=1122209 RepID=A0A1K1VFA2_9GAMM|nr:hypothetical protein [Marinospirillum alkaliphilum]SFX23735.1 hypothetical protein SAMN02745752_00939 [Marinospirillum alkaliphilum DSM 21637]